MAYSQTELLKLRDEVGRGREVANLLSNETFKKVLTDSIHGIQNAWLTCTSAEGREELWQQGAGLQTFANNLQSIVDTGKLAQRQLELDRELQKADENGNRT